MAAYADHPRIASWRPPGPSLRMVSAAGYSTLTLHLVATLASQGSMRISMLITGIICLVCTVHMRLTRCAEEKKARETMLMCAASALVHMGLLTAMYSNGGHHGTATSRSLSHSSTHGHWMLALIALDLCAALVCAMSLRGHSRRRQLIAGSAVSSSN